MSDCKNRMVGNLEWKTEKKSYILRLKPIN